MDANSTKVPTDALDGFGMHNVGNRPTHGHKKIDYLFVRGHVHPSPRHNTVRGTRSNHDALFAVIDV